LDFSTHLTHFIFAVNMLNNSGLHTTLQTNARQRLHGLHTVRQIKRWPHCACICDCNWL